MFRSLALYLSLTFAATAAPAQFYVATDGVDANPGSKTAPFATLQRARDAIRALKQTDTFPPDGAEVLVAAGSYFLNEALVLDENDTGPVTYRAIEKGTARIIGGRKIDQWQPVTDPAVLVRLDPAAREHILVSDLKAAGITELGRPDRLGPEVFFNQRAMTLARWPNEGFVKIKSMVGEPVQIDRYQKHLEGHFVYEDDRPARWTQESDAWLHGYWFHDWSEQSMKIGSIDPAKKEIRLTGKEHNYGYRKGQWYFAFNLLSEIDQPGEWYIDRTQHLLYFWPPEPIAGSETLVTVQENLLRMDKVSNTTFSGFVFEACRGRAISIKEGKGNAILHATIRNTGERGISITDGKQHRIAHCEITQTAAGGVTVYAGDRKTLTPAGHAIEHNHIHHYARIKRTYTPAIQLNGVGNRAAHNLIHHAPHMGIGFGGNDQLIEYNEIHHVCLESNDAGAIYAGRDWTARGHVLRHNYLHDVSGFEDRGAVGIYLDDAFSSAEIYGNIFHRVTRAVMIGGGRDTTVRHNIFVDCKPAFWVDSRGTGWANRYIVPGGGWHMQEKLTKANYTQPPYSVRYPKLVGILEDEAFRPKGNAFVGNVVLGEKWDGRHKDTVELIRFEHNLIGDASTFVDPANPAATHFELKPEASVFQHGFNPIAFDQIGR